MHEPCVVRVRVWRGGYRFATHDTSNHVFIAYRGQATRTDVGNSTSSQVKSVGHTHGLDRTSTLFFPLSPAQPCAAVPHKAFRKRRACRTRPNMYVLAAGALSCEAVCGATGERVLATPVSRRWSDRAHAAARGNPDESVADDASGASHGARRARARERCGACWSSAQRAPEPAYARVT